VYDTNRTSIEQLAERLRQGEVHLQGSPLSTDELRKTGAYWRACNYLALGMNYLQDNPLLNTPLKPEHIKNRLLGHFILMTPKKKARKAVKAKVRDSIARRGAPSEMDLVKRINPTLAGWVNYFRVGNASRAFSEVRDYVEMKVRTLLTRRKRRRKSSVGHFHFTSPTRLETGEASTAPVPYPTTVFQVDETTSADQGILRHQRERREDPNLDRRFGLRVGCDRSQASGPGS
jgi:hypothetical protein